jgi:hypothetical protein
LNLRATVAGRIVLALALLWAALPLAAQFTINGVTDRSTYTETVTFSVVTQAGYSYSVLLGTNPLPAGVSHTLNRADYYELLAWRTNLSAPFEVTNRLIRFIVQSDRLNPEKGLIKWTPYPPISSTSNEVAGGRLRVTAPQDYPAGLPIPVIGWVDDGQGNEIRANGWLQATGFEGQEVRVLRGVGSGFLRPATNPGLLTYPARLQSLQDTKQISIETGTVWTNVSGILVTSTVWPENSRIYLNGNLTIPASLTLTVGAGTVVKLNPLVNITNTGRLIINGTAARPVVFTATNVVLPGKPAGAWGGFVLRGASSALIANDAIFAGGGGGTGWTNWEGGSSHKSEQPVLYVHSSAAARLTNCCILNSAGQMGNGYNSDITLDHSLWQRAITGGEYVGGTIIINHSALLEFPSIDGVYSATIADDDYDGIYFTEGTHILMNSLFGFAKDDAIDSGSGSAGTVLVTNCWVESALHEAHAWSGGGRVTWSYDSVLMNCGQGLECGWSQDGGTSPICTADRMLSTANSVGTRFGDNYDWNYYGYLRPTNSLFIYNYRDTWGMNWNNWLYGINSRDGTNAMNIQGNFLSQPNTNHPNNTIWDPARDGWRLAHWMTTPLDAPVGIGLAVWTNRLTAADLTNGVPVRLSSFTTNPVSVEYTWMSPNGPVDGGTVAFAPGETLKTLPALWPTTNEPLLELVLKNPARGELTSLAQAWYFGAGQSNGGPATLIAKGSPWNYLDTGGDAGTAWRNLTYNDSGWSNGVAQLGFGDSPRDETTLIRQVGTNGQNSTTFYFRQTFVVPDPGALASLSMWLLRDDGGVVYVNGNEVFRSGNMPALPAVITYTTLADRTGTAENAVDTLTLPATLLNAGMNIVAVEIHQHDTGSSDASFDFSLTGQPTSSMPTITAQPTNQTVTVGATAEFMVSAEGTQPLAYQWWCNRTRLLDWTLGPTLTLTNVQASDAGSYQVVVVGPSGSATSQVAMLFVPSADTDGDGMPNGWEQDHGLNPFLDDANLDADADGMTNLAEYLAGTDPQDPSSYLKIDRITASWASPMETTLTFGAVAGRSYVVQYSDLLPSGLWQDLTNVTALPTNAVIVVEDPGATNTAQRYYRLRIP